MEKQLITFKEFKEYINNIKALVDLSNNVLDVMHSFNKNTNYYYDAEINYPDGVDTIIELLGKLVDDKGDNISYWVYDQEFGTCGDPNIYDVDEDGEEVIYATINTVEDLWEYITGEKVKKDEDQRYHSKGLC